VRLRLVRNKRRPPFSGKFHPAGSRTTREHLTPAEVERLMGAAGRVGRHGHRDASLILLACRETLS
jgi:hypothetical protein